MRQQGGPGFQCLKQGNPIDTRGFHGNGLDATIHKPVGQGLEIRGVGAKGAHDLLLLAVGHTGDNLMGANVDTGGVGGDCAHTGERTGFALRGRVRGRLLSRLMGTPVQDEMRLRTITLDHL